VDARLHLVRHGDVANPRHVCYADLEGFPLSRLGRRQAAAAGARLAAIAPGSRIATSPLERAIETATIIAGALGDEPVVDDRLTEWRLATRWAGVVWEDLPDVFPGELEAYLAHPDTLPFSPESIAAVAERMSASVAELREPQRDLVVVSHQDPLQALRLRLLGRPLSELGDARPLHCEIVTLRNDGGRWIEEERRLPAPGGPLSR
jgi:probable phosphoglycerate mutase